MDIFSSTAAEHQDSPIHGDRKGAMQAKTTFVPLLKKRLGTAYDRGIIKANARLGQIRRLISLHYSGDCTPNCGTGNRPR